MNAPTVFNAVFNMRQFWDGRARHLRSRLLDRRLIPSKWPVRIGMRLLQNWSRMPPSKGLHRALSRRVQRGYALRRDRGVRAAVDHPAHALTAILPERKRALGKEVRATRRFKRIAAPPVTPVLQWAASPLNTPT